MEKCSKRLIQNHTEQHTQTNNGKVQQRLLQSNTHRQTMKKCSQESIVSIASLLNNSHEQTMANLQSGVYRESPVYGHYKQRHGQTMSNCRQELIQCQQNRHSEQQTKAYSVENCNEELIQSQQCRYATVDRLVYTTVLFAGRGSLVLIQQNKGNHDLVSNATLVAKKWDSTSENAWIIIN